MADPSLTEAARALAARRATITIRCASCQHEMVTRLLRPKDAEPQPERITCSNACRQALYRQRHVAARPA